jgi:hypothetical protein
MLRSRIEAKPGEVFNIKEMINNIKEIGEYGAMREAYAIFTPKRIYYADFYYKNQEKLLN